MKRVPLNKCEIEVIECDCGYHMGIDSSFLEQVGHFKTRCPSCDKVIQTNILDSQSIAFITEE